MKKLVLIAALGVCFAGVAFGQAKAADPAVTACMKDLTTEYQALLKDHKEDNKNVSGKEEAAYKATLTKLKTDWANARKDGVSVKDCTDQRAKIKTAQADLNKMQATSMAANSSPTACMAEFKKVSAESDKIYADGIAKKTINPQEGAIYKNRDVALQKQFDTAMADKKLSLTECNVLLKSANDEKVVVTKMASSAGVAANSSLNACMAEFKKVSAESDKMFAAGVANKTIDAKEADAYKARDAALQKQFDSAVADKKLSRAECNGLLKSASDQKAEVTKMVFVAAPGAANPALNACLADLTKEYNALQADAAKTDAKVTQAERASFVQQNNELKRKWTAARQGGVTLPECQTQRADIQTVQVAYDKMQAN